MTTGPFFFRGLKQLEDHARHIARRDSAWCVFPASAQVARKLAPGSLAQKQAYELARQRMQESVAKMQEARSDESIEAGFAVLTPQGDKAT